MAPDAPALFTAGFQSRLQSEGRTSEESFNKPSTDIQRPHIEREVKESKMQENRGNQAPPLTVSRQRAEVCTPRLKDLRIGHKESSAPDSGGTKD
jgi:hypothetical protein